MEQAYQFKLDGEPIFCGRYGSGHINDTYLLVDGTARQYILQRINTAVFADPAALMGNISAVTRHLRRKAGSHREVLTLVPTLEGKDWLSRDGEHWRMYEFVSDSVSLDQVRDPREFYESAVAFGRFQRELDDFDASTLAETITRFHDTRNRYRIFRQALRENPKGRADLAAREVEFALAREDYAPTLSNLHASGDIPLRVTHNDTKLNNVLFDRVTLKALCVIDLDTVMPGFAAHDYGDSIRFGASTAAEDERELSRVGLSLELYKAYTEGFISACGGSLSQTEIETLRDGARLMTLECGVRFLTDYLLGDVYFRTTRESQNLDRSRTQFKLVADMERRWDAMQRITLAAAVCPST